MLPALLVPSADRGCVGPAGFRAFHEAHSDLALALNVSRHPYSFIGDSRGKQGAAGLSAAPPPSPPHPCSLTLPSRGVPAQPIQMFQQWLVAGGHGEEVQETWHHALLGYMGGDPRAREQAETGMQRLAATAGIRFDYDVLAQLALDETVI